MKDERWNEKRSATISYAPIDLMDGIVLIIIVHFTFISCTVKNENIAYSSHSEFHECLAMLIHHVYRQLSMCMRNE